MNTVVDSFNRLDLTRCEIECFRLEPRSQVSFRLLQRAASNKIHLVELTIARIGRAAINLFAGPWLHGSLVHRCYDQSKFLDDVPKDVRSNMGLLLHFHVEVGTNTFEIAAESYTFTLLDVIPRA